MIARLAALSLALASAASAARFTYSAEWRLMRAGAATMAMHETGAELTLMTTGVVARLVRVDDRYTVAWNKSLCTTASQMHAEEGKRRVEVSSAYSDGKVHVRQRDLVANRESTRTVDAFPCAMDAITALARLRSAAPTGRDLVFDMANDQKSARVRVAPRGKERVRTPAGEFDTVRYEASMMNGVLYARKGDLFVWLTDDERRVPVRVRLRMPFYIGAVTLQLEKEER